MASRIPSRPTLRRRLGTAAIPWMFLAPALFFFTWFKFYPMVTGLKMSFYEVQFFGDDEWVGFNNFVRALTNEDLYAATGHTLLYVIFATGLSAILGLMIAVALEGQARHLRILRTAIFLPAITSAAIIAEIWRLVFNSAPYGVVNSIIGIFGIPPQGFLTNPDQALWVLILLEIWKSVPYNMIIFIAGLVGINRELYDAASVDGASPVRKFWHVTLPGIVPAISVVVMLSFIRGFRVFAEVYATTGGGPAGATEVIMTHIYKAGFQQVDYGYASAVSLMLLCVTIVLTVIHLTITRRINS